MDEILFEQMHCDHIYPVCKGGNSSIINYVPSCKSCNLRKGSKLVTEEAKTRTVYQTKVVIKTEVVESNSWKKIAEDWQYIYKTSQENIKFAKILENNRRYLNETN
jgi:hypothetical protein